MLISVDPGVGGGISIFSNNKVYLKSYKEFLKEKYLFSSKDTVVIERVHSMPGQGVVSQFTFGMNFGWWLGYFHSQGINPIFIEPKKWQQHFDIPKSSYTERKKYCLNMAQGLLTLFECSSKVTLKTSDAFLIGYYYIHHN